MDASTLLNSNIQSHLSLPAMESTPRNVSQIHARVHVHYYNYNYNQIVSIW